MSGDQRGGIGRRNSRRESPPPSRESPPRTRGDLAAKVVVPFLVYVLPPPSFVRAAGDRKDQRCSPRGSASWWTGGGCRWLPQL